MAACESLRQMFESGLPEKLGLIETLSPWKQMKHSKATTAVAEIFGELHFQEIGHPQHEPASSLFSPPLQMPPKEEEEEEDDDDHEERRMESSFSGIGRSQSVGSSAPSTPKSEHSDYSHRKSDSFSSMNSESLQLCTEGLGFESCDDLEDLMRVDTSSSTDDDSWRFREERRRLHLSSGRLCREFRRSRSMGAGFPPPIPSISMSGKPWVCFKSYRHDGRFVLKEIRIPTQEFLQASREDGRLRLHFVQPKDEVLEEEAEDDDEDAAAATAPEEQHDHRDDYGGDPDEGGDDP